MVGVRLGFSSARCRVVLLLLGVCTVASILASPTLTQHDSVSVHIGVPVEKLPLYEAAQLYCDTNVIVPRKHINDNFCDCPISGLDEPGTSACSNGQFSCTNKGFKREFLPSSRVNDGICDCCDGSDEYESSTLCRDRCIEAARESAKTLLDKQAIIRRGLERRPSLLEDARRIRDDEKLLLVECQEDIDKIEASLEDLKRAKMEAEAKEEEERNALELEKKGGSENPDQNPVESPEEHSDLEAAETNPADNERVTPSTESEPGQTSADKGADHPQTPTDETSFPYPQEYALQADSSSNDGDGDADGEADDGEEEFGLDALDVDNAPSEDDEESEVVQVLINDWLTSFRDIWASARSWLNAVIWNDNTPQFRPVAKKARSELLEAERKLKAARTRLEDAEKMSRIDYGDDDVYLPLRGKCFELAVNHYVYELCPFNKVAQKENTHSTSLGNFFGWDKERTGWVFQGGHKCWNGPARSAMVYIECSEETRIVSVSEPSTCAYEMHMGTAAACTQEDIDTLQRHIEAIGVPPEAHSGGEAAPSVAEHEL